MATDALKSLSITNLDSLAPGPIRNVAGEGAPGATKTLNDYVTPTASGLASTSSKYKLIRLPSNAKLKRLKIEADAALDTNGSPTLAIDVGAYYSDSTMDGTPPASTGTAISTSCFAANVSFAVGASTLSVDATPKVANRNVPLWSAAGLTADPGGMIDVVVAIHTGAATGSAQNFGAQADYIF